MDDIVQRLRACRISTPEDHPVHPPVCEEAAGTIASLRCDIEWHRKQFSVLSDAYSQCQKVAKLGEAVRALVRQEAKR